MSSILILTALNFYRDELSDTVIISNSLQWRSEIRPPEIQKHSKLGLFEGRILNGLDFKWSGFSYG